MRHLKQIIRVSRQKITNFMFLKTPRLLSMADILSQKIWNRIDMFTEWDTGACWSSFSTHSWKWDTKMRVNHGCNLRMWSKEKWSEKASKKPWLAVRCTGLSKMEANHWTEDIRRTVTLVNNGQQIMMTLPEDSVEIIYVLFKALLM